MEDVDPLRASRRTADIIMQTASIVLCSLNSYVHKIYKQHATMKLLDCEWDGKMKLCEEALKYSQGENEYTAVIFNEGKSFL
jgi:hypothetical protein